MLTLRVGLLALVREVPVALSSRVLGRFCLRVSMCAVAQLPARHQEGQGLWDQHPLTPVTTGGKPARWGGNN